MGEDLTPTPEKTKDTRWSVLKWGRTWLLVALLVVAPIRFLSFFSGQRPSYPLLFVGVAFLTIALRLREKREVSLGDVTIGYVLDVKKARASVVFILLGAAFCLAGVKPLGRLYVPSGVHIDIPFGSVYEADDARSDTSEGKDTTVLPRNADASSPPMTVVDDPVLVSQDPLLLGFTRAPKYQIHAVSNQGLKPDFLVGALGRIRWGQKISLPTFPRHHMNAILESNDRQLTATVDTGPIIDELDSETRYGWYRLLCTIDDAQRPRVDESHVDFNYIYQEDFEDPERVLVAHDWGFSRISKAGGLRIENDGSHDYISATLRAVFDFTMNFAVEGSFSLEPDNRDDPAGLDIAFLDEQFVSRLSVVLVDGGLNIVSIKVNGDRDADVRHRTRQPVVVLTTEQGVNVTHFRIEVRPSAVGVLCRVFVSPNAPVNPRGLPILQREIEARFLPQDLMRIQLRLWKAGVAKLYRITVAELEPGGRRPG